MFLAFFVSIVLIPGTNLPRNPLTQARNTIEGRITNSDNRPIENARVFLLTDDYGQVEAAYTDASGRYRFRGISSGHYYVQVEPTGTAYERQMQRIDVDPISLRGGGGGEIFRIDFVLRPPKPTKTDGDSSAKGAGGTIFYQQIPDAAKQKYLRGVSYLQKDDFQTATAALKQAIEIFPDYYDALELLGTEYVKRSDYQSALPLLMHVVEVNKNGGEGFYALGVALLGSNQRTSGLDALRRSVQLNPKSINANMRLGLELAKDEQTRTEAIKVLTNVTRLAGKRLPEAYLALASLYSRDKKYDQAADALESYLRAAPQTEQRDKIKQKIEQLRQKASQPQDSKP